MFKINWSLIHTPLILYTCRIIWNYLIFCLKALKLFVIWFFFKQLFDNSPSVGSADRNSEPDPLHKTYVKLGDDLKLFRPSFPWHHSTKFFLNYNSRINPDFWARSEWIRGLERVFPNCACLPLQGRMENVKKCQS